MELEQTTPFPLPNQAWAFFRGPLISEEERIFSSRTHARTQPAPPSQRERERERERDFSQRKKLSLCYIGIIYDFRQRKKSIQSSLLQKYNYVLKQRKFSLAKFVFYVVNGSWWICLEPFLIPRTSLYALRHGFGGFLPQEFSCLFSASQLGKKRCLFVGWLLDVPATG